MKSTRLFLAVTIVLIASSWATAQTSLGVVRTTTPPDLDGKVDDAVWAKAPDLELKAQGRGGPAEGKTTSVVLKAAYDDQNVYFLLRWQDARKNDTHKSYVWNADKSVYETGPDREDNAALAFPIRGAFSADMLSGKDELWDVWHWKAQRTGPAGYAMDRTHVFSSTKPSGKAKKFTTKAGKELWIARPEDEGTSVTAQSSAPSTKQASTPVHYQAVNPTGSAADIRTGHSYRDGWWTVEFARKLNTGNRDDAPFIVPKTRHLGVAVFDKSEHEHHYTVGPIALIFGRSFTFDSDKVGLAPVAWSIRQTNPSNALATWKVTSDPTALSKPNVLTLSKTDNYGSTFNLAIAEGMTFRDLELSVRVKALSGEEDQGGGPIWRCKDENNYYVCRLNPLEGNFRVYFVKNGRRKQLNSTKVETKSEWWYTVRVTMVGSEISCYLDGKKLLEAKDETLAEGGMVGLWTKADATTSFDDLIVGAAETND